MSTHPQGSVAYRATATVAAVIAAAVFLLVGTALAQGPDPDRFIVKFQDGKGPQGKAAIRSAGGELLVELEPQNAAAFRIPAEALAGISRNPNIEYIEVDPPRYPMAQVVPYGITMVQANPAVTDGVAPGTAARPKVCVIDSGYDRGHEDLPSGTGITGFPSGSQTWYTDTCGHGTHVAGTIAALHNTTGVVGVMGSGVDLVIAKVFDGANCSYSYASSVAHAANECAKLGANIINMSLGCTGNRCKSTTEENTFNTLANQGVLSIAAAGNAGNTQLSYPASYSSVVSVAAVDETKTVATFSQKNSQVELSGPGVGVQSTVPRGMGFVATVSVGGQGYAGAGMEGSPTGVVSNRDLVNCGLGTSQCAAGGGKICIIERGEISFADKVLACQNGGGSAAVIYNNEAGVLNGTLGGIATAIPSMGISQADGQAIIAALPASGSVALGVGDYDFYSGTSMATPHVAGVAALLWSHVPSAGAAGIRQALQATAEDLGAAGRDTSYGFGLVRTADALAYLGGSSGGGGGDDGSGGGGGGGDPTGITARVSSITLTTTTRGPNTRTTATATIVNADGGGALAGASVTGCFGGAVNGCSTGTTNSNGQVSFDSGNYRSGSVSFCVTEVTGTGIDTFDNAGNCTP